MYVYISIFHPMISTFGPPPHVLLRFKSTEEAEGTPRGSEIPGLGDLRSPWCYSPEKERMSPENHWLKKDVFLESWSVSLKGHVSFRGVL